MVVVLVTAAVVIVLVTAVVVVILVTVAVIVVLVGDVDIQALNSSIHCAVHSFKFFVFTASFVEFTSVFVDAVRM